MNEDEKYTWLDRQRDREANGENWRRLFGTDRNEVCVGFLISEWGLGLDVGGVDEHRWFNIIIGPFTIGYLRWVPKR